MILLIIMIILLFIALVMVGIGFEECEGGLIGGGFVVLVICIAYFINGIINGFIDYKPTHGAHQGTITAVDLEGHIFRHYHVYLKSSAYTQQGDETEYCVYEYETELIEKLNKYMGKPVKLTYGHNGGKIGINNCGTYHITNVELLEDDKNE